MINFRTALLAAACSVTCVAMPAHAVTTITFQVDNSANSQAVAKGLVSDFEAANPGLKVEIETRPIGSEGDNVVKTRLATDSMSDVFMYNSGALFQAINPAQTLVDLTNEPWQENVYNNYKPAVSANGKIYGGPFRTGMAGGILYNRTVYEKLGLSVPKTWAEFMANNAKIKAAGITPVIQTYATPWTSQLFVLADFYNLNAAEPDFAQKYTNNKAKYATDTNALRGFQRLEEIGKSGFVNSDFASADYGTGLRQLAEGRGAHYPTLTFAIAAIAKDYPAHLKDIGFFAQPGDDASKNGATAWLPAGIFIARTASDVDAAKKFVAFVVSKAGCESENKAVGATGPYMIKGCPMPDNVPPSVADMMPYFQDDARNSPALEFLSPIKGPSLQQITVEVGSGLRSAKDGAALYDQDVQKQAQQLGLPNW